VANQLFASVTSSAALVVAGEAQYGNETVTIFNPPTSGVTCYLGAGSGVTTSTGCPFPPGSESVLINLPTAGVWGITAANTAVTLTVTQSIS